MKRPPTVTFVTGHYYNSPRRAGFHNLADAAHHLGCTVNFVTVAFSLLSYLRRDYRCRVPGIRNNWNTAVRVRPGFTSYVHFTSWHPMTLLVPALNRLSMRLMNLYGRGSLGDLLPLVRATDVFVFESTPGLFLFTRFRRENPSARMIYRVSDDVRVLRSAHPRLVALEQEIAGGFDCISVPTSSMLDKFPQLPAHRRPRLDRHGLDKQAYDACTASPYAEGTRNAVCVSTWDMDLDFLRAAALAAPECTLHVIGPFADTLHLPNVRGHGEMPFARTIPYVKFADEGLHTIAYRNEHSRSFTDALKVIQYRYCGLPIVAPDFLDLQRDGVFLYHPANAPSCGLALRQALAAGRNPDFAAEVHTWDVIMDNLLRAVMCELPGKKDASGGPRG